VAGQDGEQQYPLAEYFASLEASPAAISARFDGKSFAIIDRTVDSDMIASLPIV
jgi:hypothetical protein